MDIASLSVEEKPRVRIVVEPELPLSESANGNVTLKCRLEDQPSGKHPAQVSTFLNFFFFVTDTHTNKLNCLSLILGEIHPSLIFEGISRVGIYNLFNKLRMIRGRDIFSM